MGQFLLYQRQAKLGWVVPKVGAGSRQGKLSSMELIDELLLLPSL